MVHKKSEYRLSYKWLPADVKSEILKISASNIDYRMQRRQRDLSHHPWEWHCIDDSCECDEADEGDRFLPLPPLRQKHNMLLDEWHRKAPAICADGQLPITARHAEEPIAVAGSERKEMPPKCLSRLNEVQLQSPDERRIATNRSTGEARFSPLRIDAAAARHKEPRLFENQIRSRLDSLNIPDEQSQSARIKDYSHLKGGGHRFNMAMSDRGFDVKNARRLRTDVVPCVPIKPPVVVNRPSSTTKRADWNALNILSEKRPPFHTYGWANSVNEIGKQQTHNIRVKSEEVHPSALLAKKIKNDLGRPNLIGCAKKSKSTSNLTTVNCPVNHSSLWVTEYQRHYYTKRPIGD